MLKLIGALLFGTATAGAAVYFITRPQDKRQADVNKIKGKWARFTERLSAARDGWKIYLKQLFNNKPESPATAEEPAY